MNRLRTVIENCEDRVIAIVIAYATRQQYTKYTSTLEEAWRASVRGISESLLSAMERYDGAPELSPDEDFANDPVAAFGILEAQRHRERGVRLAMFLGLYKYYKQSYLDVLREAGFDAADERRFALFLERCFDRMEIGYCDEWARLSRDGRVRELQDTNRRMTNEKNKYLTIFESLKDPVILLNADNEIENMNLAATRLLNGRSSPGALYYSEKDVRAPATQPAPGHARDLRGSRLEHALPRLAQLIRELQPAGGNGSFEFEMPVGDDMRCFSVLLSRMLDISGKFNGAIVMLHDVTGRRRAEDELIRTERLVAAGELAASVAHEVNSPLQAATVLIGSLKKRLVKGDDSADVINDMEILKRAFDAIRDVVRLLLNLNRPLMEWELCNVNDVINKTAELMAGRLKQGNIEIRMEQARDLPPVFASRQQLGQVFMNLFTNTLEAVSEREDRRAHAITVATSLSCGVAVIRFSDTGPGIPPEKLEHIFEPFYTQKMHPGMGLGLSLCRRIIEDHGGAIRADNGGHGGAVFTITLPVSEASDHERLQHSPR